MWALYAQAYFDRYGVGPEQLGWVAVNGRRMAAGNPNAIYREQITLDDYMASRMISTPICLSASQSPFSIAWFAREAPPRCSLARPCGCAIIRRRSDLTAAG